MTTQEKELSTDPVVSSADSTQGTPSRRHRRRLPFKEALFAQVIEEMSPPPDTRAIEEARQRLTREYNETPIRSGWVPGSPTAKPYEYPSKEERSSLQIASVITQNYYVRYIE